MRSCPRLNALAWRHAEGHGRRGESVPFAALDELAYTAPVFAINMILPGIPGFEWLYRDAVNHVPRASFTKWALATPVQFTSGGGFHVRHDKS